MGLYEEETQQAEEAQDIFERLEHPVQQAQRFIHLAWLLPRKKRLGATEETAFHAIDFLPEEDEKIRFYDCHHVLGTNINPRARRRGPFTISI